MIGLTFIHPDWWDTGDFSFLESRGWGDGFQKGKQVKAGGECCNGLMEMMVRYDGVDYGGGGEGERGGFLCCLSACQRQ